MFVGPNTYSQGIWKTRVGAHEKCQAWSKHEHFSSGWHPPRNWHDLCHTVIEFEQKSWRLSGRRVSWSVKIPVEGRFWEIDVPIVLYPECGAFWDWASIKNQTRSQVIPTSCNLHIPLTFTVFGSFWVFSPWIFIANLHLQSQTACLTNTCQMPPLNTAKMAWEVVAHKAFQRFTNEPLLCNAFEVVLIGSQIVRNPAIGWPPIFDTFLLFLLQSTVALLHYLLVQGIFWGVSLFLHCFVWCFVFFAFCCLMCSMDFSHGVSVFLFLWCFCCFISF